MVSRKTGWRIVTLAAAVSAAAGADGPLHPAAARGPIPPADIPNVAARPPEGRANSGRPPTRREPPARREAPAREPAPNSHDAPPPPPAPGGAHLVWGGPLPSDDMGYVPSPAYGDTPARGGAGFAAPSDPEPFYAEPEPAYAEPETNAAETVPAEPAFDAAEPPVDPGPGQYGRTYPVRELNPQVRGDVEPSVEPLVREASLPAPGPSVMVHDAGSESV